MGWLTDMDDPVVREYDSNWYFDQELVFYIENTRLVELNVEFVYELSDEDFFEIVGDETGKVAGGANESFTIQVRPVNDADMRSFSPDSIVTLDVTAAETSQVGMSTSSNTIDGEFKVEKVFDLSLEFVDGPTQMHAGTWVDWNLQLVNNGNNDDTASSLEFDTRSCPSLSQEGLEGYQGKAVKPTGVDNAQPLEVAIKLEASSSHPQRDCEVTFSVVSEGDGMSRSITLDMSVKAAEEQDDPVVGEDDDDTSSGLSVGETDSLPFLGFVEIISLLAISSIYLSRRQ